MKTNVSSTAISRDAYRHIVESEELSPQEGEIVAFLSRRPRQAFTRYEIAEAMGLHVASVCSRCFSLIKRGALLEGPRRNCRVTGFVGHILQIGTAKPLWARHPSRRAKSGRGRMRKNMRRR